MNVDFVLRIFALDPGAGSIGVSGRMAGLRAFIMTAVGIDPVVSLDCSPAEVRFHAGSIKGQSLSVVPVTRVATAECGFTHNPLSLVFGVSLILLCILGECAVVDLYGNSSQAVSMGGTLFVFVCLGGAAILHYYLSKRVFFAFETVGGRQFRVSFRGAIAGGQTVDLKQAQAAMEIIRRNILSSQAVAFAELGAGAPTVASVQAPSVFGYQCPHCSASLEPGSQFCEGCGADLSQGIQ